MGSFSEGASRHQCVPARARARRTGAISYQTCVTRLMMCSTNQPRVYSIFILPRSWQLKRWIVSRWPEIRLWTRPVSLSTECWGLKGTSAIRATQRPCSLPDKLLACPVANRSTQTHTVRCVCVSLSDSVQYEVIITRFSQSSKQKNSTTNSLLCGQMTRPKPDEKIICRKSDLLIE